MAKGGYAEAIRPFERGLAALAGVEDAGARARLEFEITGSLGNALIATMGYAAPRVHETFARASALCDQLGEDVPLEVLYGVWSVHLVRGDVEATAALLPRFVGLAERTRDALVELTAHAVVGLRALLTGDLSGAERELDRAVQILDQPGSLDLLRQLPYSGAVYPIAWRTLLLLYRGSPQRALASRDRLNEVAARIGDPYGVAVAGHFSALLARDLGDAAGARELAERQIAWSREQKILLWQSSSECIRGWARAVSGDPAGVPDLAGNVALLRAIGLRTTLPTLLAFVAEAELAAGHTGEALAAVADARALCAATLDRYYLAELHRIEGVARLAAGDPVAARTCLSEALETARRQGAPWFALRASTELARLPGASDRDALRSALAAIEGGAGTAHVDAARALLTPA
jgi:predicted ATPase